MATVAASLPPSAAHPPAPLARHRAAAPPATVAAKLLEMDGKAKLAVLGDRPLVAETPQRLLDDDVTPTDKLFVRNNGQFPGRERSQDVEDQGRRRGQHAARAHAGELIASSSTSRYQLMLECGGNGRSLLRARGARQPVDNGGVGCAAMDRRAAGRRAEGRRPEVGAPVYTVHYGRSDLRRDRQAHDLARHADREGDRRHTLIAFKLNGQDLPFSTARRFA